MRQTLLAMEAVYALLNGTVRVNGKVVPVYDGTAPEGKRGPYIIIGEETSVDAGAQGIQMREMTLTISAWSESTSRIEIKTILNNIHNRLHLASLNIAEGSLVRISNEFETTIVHEGKPRMRQGIQRYRILVNS